MKKIIKVVDESLSKGWKMSKKISSGGIFSYPTYDIRTIYNRNDLHKLVKDGFCLDDDAGLIALNILLKL